MTAEYEYAERFADLMEDMQGDGVDAMNVLGRHERPDELPHGLRRAGDRR